MATLTRGKLDALRALYPKGTRVELVHMQDPYNKDLKPGSKGTVDHIDDIGTIHVSWDCGSGLGVVYGEDQCRKITGEVGLCKVCGRDMHQAKGCVADYVFCDGKKHRRVRCGEEGWVDPGNRCTDCGALHGRLHHWGCDVERCPSCGLQLINCDCEEVYIEA